MRRQRLDAIRQARVAFEDAGVGPAHRRGWIDRRIEVVAEHSADGFLVALGDGDAVDDRRPKVLGLAVENLRQCARFGFEALHPLVGFGQRRAAGFQRLPRDDMRRLGGLHREFGLPQHLLRGLDGAGERVDVAEAAGLRRDLLDVRIDGGDFVVEPRQPVAMGAHVGFELGAPRGEVGQRRSQFREGAFGRGKRRLGLGDALIDAAAQFDAGPDLFLEFGVLGIEPRQCRVGIEVLLLLALDVGGELRQAAIKLDHALLGALFLAVEHLARVVEALQPGGGASFRFAQRRKFGRADCLDAGGLGLMLGAFGHLADAEIVGLAGVVDVGMGLQPAQVEQSRLGLAHARRDLAIADRLPRLLLEALDLARQLPDHVLDAREICLGGFQPQFGLVAAGVQPGDARGVFQHAAALLGLRLNDFADLALVHQGRGPRAGGGVGEQDLYVAGAHVAAVDAVDRAGVTLDAAGNFKGFLVVERRRRGAVGVVDGHHHFGVVARRAAAGAGKDHRFHVGGAQRLVGRLAHRPAQRLDQIGLAAAVRPDHAGQARLDQEVGRLDKGFKSVQAKARKFHE